MINSRFLTSAIENLWFTNEADNGIITSKGTTAHKGVGQIWIAKPPSNSPKYSGGFAM